jgi:predicted enzyme related to lactoylglutathione lyase
MPDSFRVGLSSSLRRSRRTVVWLLGVVILVAACARSGVLPAISTDTGATGPTHIPGKFVWHALLTDDVPAAKHFYGEAFGWSFESTTTEGYTLIRSSGRRVGAIIDVERRNPDEPVTQWLSFLSVADVDVSTALFEAEGKIYREPMDVPGFGRVAVVADPQGAPLVLLRSVSGDPPDGKEPPVGEFLWIDYVASEPDAAGEFYRRLVGWEARKHDSPTGDYWVMWHGDRGRAGMFTDPWPSVKPNWLPYVRVEDTQASVDRIAQLGGEVVLAPSQAIRNGTTAIIIDPLGAGVVLQSYPF